MGQLELPQEVFDEFLSENREALDLIERELLHLEETPDSQELLNNIFRHMHTVKGNCRLVGFERLETLGHQAENLLDLVRNRKLVVDEKVSTLLLEVLDALRDALDRIAHEKSDDGMVFSHLIGQLQQAAQSADNRPEEVEVASDSTEEELGIELDLSDSISAIEPPQPALSTNVEELGEKAGLQTIRLSIEKLDGLMDMVGEMAASFNQMRFGVLHGSDRTTQNMEALEQHIHTLQDEILQYRLQPIGQVWETYHRLIRDLAVSTGKKVMLNFSGEETEVDRSILLSVKDFMVHMLRNAVDHGIEDPQTRKEAGKSVVGKIQLEASRRHGWILLTIADDGAGLDVANLRRIAIERGLIDQEEALNLSDQAACELILQPGFSTRGEVNAISGRGAGMDAVSAAIQKVGGTLRIYNTPGHGTRFIIRIPQTMAIVPALIVRVGQSRYAIPQNSVVELISYYSAEVAEHLENKMQAPMTRVRDQLLPLLDLEMALEERIPPEGEDALAYLQQQETLHLVVVQAEDRRFTLRVSDIDEPAPLVVKPMPQVFKTVQMLAGSAVMPDGSISFLLNIPELSLLLED
ncbi:chemotaxis protein CheA [Magnetococcus sp. PR-3]|uniref:chemotaxis protein CheA n=1 Tax=Magnetococcus sp. PR-3 TaxID=3120355 RepID=UPI002FCE0B36